MNIAENRARGINKQMYPYLVVLGLLIIFTAFAFTQQKPLDLFNGLIEINKTRSVLLTDYIEIGGMGAAFMNASLITIISLIFLVRLKIVPTGPTIAALFLTFGFAMFGKNILNMMPVTFGVWLFSRIKGRPFSDYYIAGLLAATISPITSEIMFLDISSRFINIVLGVSLGALSGFLFPMLSEFTLRIQKGYNLYNMGFVGGILATFFLAILTSLGIEVAQVFYISGGNNLKLGILLFSISVFLILCGIILGNRKKLFSDLSAVMKYPGIVPSDYYSSFGANIYVNMGILCALGTALVLIMGAELNGPTIAGVLTITGFGAYGKHLKNVIPLLTGAIIATLINKWSYIYTPNVLGILFSTGLAPLAGKHGIVWGVILGFLHVCILHHIGGLCNGLNLYNNGFAAGFVVILMLPIIEGVKKLSAKEA